MPSGIKPYQNLETEPQRLDLQAQNQAFEARDVTDWYPFRTSLLTKLFGFYGHLAIFASYKPNEVYKTKASKIHQNPSSLSSLFCWHSQFLSFHGKHLSLLFSLFSISTLSYVSLYAGTVSVSRRLPEAVERRARWATPRWSPFGHQILQRRRP